MNKISILFLMLMLISTSAVAKQSLFVDNSQTVQPSRSSDVSTPIMSDSYDIEVDGLYYEITSISDLTVELVGGVGVYKGSIEIPSELEYRGKKLKVTSIGDEAFFKSNVTNVTIGENVESIGRKAFSKSAISKIVIPSSVITLGEYSFDDCSQLVDVNFEDGKEVLKFYDTLFKGCPIRKLYIGRTIDYSLIDPAFADLSNTLEIEIGPYVKTLNALFLKGASKISSLRIPASVTYLGDGAFDGCVSLKSVIFEDGTNTLVYTSGHGSVTSGGTVNYDMFCDSPLNYVYIGRNCKVSERYRIVGSIFAHSPITKIDISDSVTELVELFGLYKLQEINIPSSVVKISYIGGNNLSRIVCNSATPPVFEDDMGFSNRVYANATLYVPKGCVKAYEGAKVWKKFFDIKEISLSGINDVPNDGQENQTNVFYDVNGVKHKNWVKGLNIIKTKNGIVKKIHVK